MVINLFESSRRGIARGSSSTRTIKHEAPAAHGRVLGRGTAVRIALAVVALGAVGWGVWASGSWEAISSPERVRALIEGFGAWAPIVYVFAEIVQVIVPPIPGDIFPPIAAALFGPEAALLLTMTGTTIGSAIVFALARRWGRPLLERVVDPAIIDRYARVISARGGLWLFVIMVLPFLPDDAICAMMGSSAISFRRFLILTALGRLPSTLCGIYLTSSLLSVPPRLAIFTGAIVLLLLALGFSQRDRLEGWLLRQADVG